MVDVLQILMADLNFRARLFIRRDRKWGSIDAQSGEWNGMVSSLLKGEADLIFTSLSMNDWRFDGSSVFSTHFLLTTWPNLPQLWSPNNESCVAH